MTQQRTYDDSRQYYKRRLFVKTTKGFVEVKARIVEPYSPPVPTLRSKELTVLDSNSQLSNSMPQNYKFNFTLLFTEKDDYHEYLKTAYNMHKFYDERGNIFLGSLESIKTTNYEGVTKFKCEVSFIMVRKDWHEVKDNVQFVDLFDDNMSDDVIEMASAGLVSYMTADGQPVYDFRPDAKLTRAEMAAFLGRTYRHLEKQLRV